MTIGIYSITNTSNGKRYYGSSVNMEGRKRQHWSALRNGRHKNPHLQAAWKKYGEGAFEFAVVELVSQDRLVATEQRYLDGNQGGYNIGKFADCAPRGLKWSDESKKRMSEARKGTRLSEECKRKLSIAGTGRKTSPETRAKLSAANSGKSHKSQTKAKLAEAGRNKWSDGQYRERMIAAQQAGKNTEDGKRNYSSSSKSRWADPEYRAMMSERRKRMWADPDFKARMLAVRKEQGKRFSGKNWRDRPKKKEQCNALQKSA